MPTVNVFGTFSHWSLSFNILYMTNFLSTIYSTIYWSTQCRIPHLEIRGEGGAGRPDPEMEGGVSKNFFLTLRASVWSENKVGPRALGSPGPSPGSATAINGKGFAVKQLIFCN